MESRSKKIFLIACVVVPFLIYCIIYYAQVFKNAPYKFSEFKSIVFQYGTPDSMLNRYDSNTGDYQYVNAHDSVIKIKLHLPKEQLLYLHRKAAELGFWDWPSDERGDTTVRHNGQKAPRYFMQFNYQRKSKTITFDESFIGDPRLKAANENMKDELIKVLDEEAAKQK